MYWHPQHGANQVAGDILFQWGYAGFEKGFWGYPTGDPIKQTNEWDKMYNKHNVRSLYSLAYYIEHLCPVRDENGRSIYESPVYRDYCETPVSCEPTGEWFTGRLVYDKTPVVDSDKPLGSITFTPSSELANQP